MAGPFARPVRGDRLETVLAQRREVDREIGRAEQAVAERLSPVEHEREARDGGGRMFASAKELASPCLSPSPCTPAEAVSGGGDRGKMCGAGIGRGGSLAGPPARLSLRGRLDVSHLRLRRVWS